MLLRVFLQRIRPEEPFLTYGARIFLIAVHEGMPPQVFQRRTILITNLTFIQLGRVLKFICFIRRSSLVVSVVFTLELFLRFLIILSLVRIDLFDHIIYLLCMRFQVSHETLSFRE